MIRVAEVPETRVKNYEASRFPGFGEEKSPAGAGLFDEAARSRLLLFRQAVDEQQDDGAHH